MVMVCNITMYIIIIIIYIIWDSVPQNWACGPIPIDLYCLLTFMPSVMEIQLNKLRALFHARFAPMI